MKSPIEGETASPKPPRDPLMETVCALTDPIIVFPAQGWEDDLPEPLRKRLPIDRLAHVMMAIDGKEPWDECTDIEALLYMYPRTMLSSLSEQWVRIYMYLGTRAMGEAIPDDIREEKLSDYDMSELRKLKRWIQEKKLKARKDRERQASVEAPEETQRKQNVSTSEYEQLGLGF